MPSVLRDEQLPNSGYHTKFKSPTTRVLKKYFIPNVYVKIVLEKVKCLLYFEPEDLEIYLYFVIALISQTHRRRH